MITWLTMENNRWEVAFNLNDVVDGGEKKKTQDESKKKDESKRKRVIVTVYSFFCDRERIMSRFGWLTQNMTSFHAVPWLDSR